MIDRHQKVNTISASISLNECHRASVHSSIKNKFKRLRMIRKTFIPNLFLTYFDRKGKSVKRTWESTIFSDQPESCLLLSRFITSLSQSVSSKEMKNRLSNKEQEPITRNVQLAYFLAMAFSQVGLFLDKAFPRKKLKINCFRCFR